jgi:hypothetical protein
MRRTVSLGGKPEATNASQKFDRKIFARASGGIF